MNEQLEYLRSAAEHLRVLQKNNSRLHTDVADAITLIPQLEINQVLDYLKRIDCMLAVELEQVGEAIERTEAEIEATNPVDEAGVANSFDDFIAGLLADIQDRNDLVGRGETFTATFRLEGENGGRQVHVSVTDDGQGFAAGETPA